MCYSFKHKELVFVLFFENDYKGGSFSLLIQKKERVDDPKTEKEKWTQKPNTK
jgi:hypothetical protein